MPDRLLKNPSFAGGLVVLAGLLGSSTARLGVRGPLAAYPAFERCSPPKSRSALRPAAGLSGRANELTSYGGWIWFCSRVVYLSAYASRLRWLRSIVWGVATIAVAAMALGLVLGVS